MPRRSSRNAHLDPSLADGRVDVYNYIDEQQYGIHIARLFPFMRSNANGAYSDVTMMRCVRAAEDFQNRALFNDHQRSERLPLLCVFTMPYSYDELTEVKKGGTLGMVASWRDKAIIAVHESCRRMNVGTTLYSNVVNALGHYPPMWAGRNNFAGQHFLLTQGLTPSAMNASGAIRYSRGEVLVDD